MTSDTEMKPVCIIPQRRHHRAKQSGAALVVALILLVALSLMAISSMNTASLDLIMAGNEQFRSRSFVAAEAGIEYAMDFGTLDSGADYGSGNTIPATAIAIGSGRDTYKYTITRPNGGALESAPEFSSMNAGSGVSRITFRVESTGTSERGTTSTHVQELYKVTRSSDALTAATECGTAAAANLDGTTSSC